MAQLNPEPTTSPITITDIDWAIGRIAKIVDDSPYQLVSATDYPPDEKALAEDLLAGIHVYASTTRASSQAQQDVLKSVLSTNPHHYKIYTDTRELALQVHNVRAPDIPPYISYPLIATYATHLYELNPFNYRAIVSELKATITDKSKLLAASGTENPLAVPIISALIGIPPQEFFRPSDNNLDIDKPEREKLKALLQIAKFSERNRTAFHRIWHALYHEAKSQRKTLRHQPNLIATKLVTYMSKQPNPFRAGTPLIDQKTAKILTRTKGVQGSPTAQPFLTATIEFPTLLSLSIDYLIRTYKLNPLTDIPVLDERIPTIRDAQTMVINKPIGLYYKPGI